MKLLLYIFLLVVFSMSANAQYLSGTSYYGANNYIEYIAGDMPIIVVAPHAGILEPNTLPDINTRGEDNGTMTLSRYLADSLHFKTGGCRPHVIINHLKPSKLNPVFSEADSVDAAGTNPNTLQALRDFYFFIQIAYSKIKSDWGKGHYFELHGNGTPEEWNMIGIGVPKNHLKMSDTFLMTRVNQSTVKNLCTVGGANFLEILKGPTSLGGMLEAKGWKSTTSPRYPSPPDSVTFFYAGQNTWRFGSKDSGTIDATHIESYWKFMVLPVFQSKYFNDLADVMLRFMNLHYGFIFNCQKLGLNSAEIDSKLKIFPNPINTNTILQIESADNNEEVYIFNSLGQLCWFNKEFNCPKILNVNPGVYTVIVKNFNGKTEFQNLIVK